MASSQSCSSEQCSCPRLPLRRALRAEPFHQRFDAVLTRHGIVGGAIAIVHDPGPPTAFFFGMMRNGAHERVDGQTSYNWASITKTMTGIAILQLRDRGKS